MDTGAERNRALAGVQGTKETNPNPLVAEEQKWAC